MFNSMITISFIPQLQTGGCLPEAPQFAGTQGDNGRYEVRFEVPETVSGDQYLYRVEMVTGGGALLTSDLLPWTDGMVSLPLTRLYTESGGRCTVRLVVTSVDENGDETAEASWSGTIYFADREGAESRNAVHHAISEMLYNTCQNAEAAEKQASAAVEAAEQARQAEAQIAQQTALNEECRAEIATASESVKAQSQAVQQAAAETAALAQQVANDTSQLATIYQDVTQSGMALATDSFFNVRQNDVTTNSVTGEIALFNTIEGSYNTVTEAAECHVEGTENTVSGLIEAAHVGGKGNTATGSYAFAHGSGCTASGEGTHAEGLKTVAAGKFSLALGEGSQSLGIDSVACGTANSAEGRNAIAGGTRCVAKAEGCVSIGEDSQNNGMYSLQTGARVITGENSQYSLTSGQDNGSTAAPIQLQAGILGGKRNKVGTKGTVQSALVCGESCEVEGSFSLTAGYYLQNSQDCSLVVGQWNEPVKTGTVLFSVGNGSGENARHNALTVEKDGALSVAGNANFQQSVSVLGSLNVNGLDLLQTISTMQAQMEKVMAKVGGVS